MLQLCYGIPTMSPMLEYEKMKHDRKPSGMRNVGRLKRLPQGIKDLQSNSTFTIRPRGHNRGKEKIQVNQVYSRPRQITGKNAPRMKQSSPEIATFRPDIVKTCERMFSEGYGNNEKPHNTLRTKYSEKGDGSEAWIAPRLFMPRMTPPESTS